MKQFFRFVNCFLHSRQNIENVVSFHAFKLHMFNSRVVCFPVAICNKIGQCHYSSCSQRLSSAAHYNYCCSPFIYKINVSSVSFYSTQDQEKLKSNDSSLESHKKLSLFQRFKEMYRKYWYVLLPVHVVTSIGWFGSFYFLAKSGVDVIATLEYLGASDIIINPLRDSSAGYIAVAYALYKIATPVRYAVTIAGTTVSIKLLVGWGLIRPMPNKEQLKEMYQEKKEQMIEKRDVFAEEMRHKRDKLRDKQKSFIKQHKDPSSKG